MLDLTDKMGSERHYAVMDHVGDNLFAGQINFDNMTGALIILFSEFDSITASQMQFALSMQYAKNGKVYVFDQVKMATEIDESRAYDGEWIDSKNYYIALTWKEK